MPQLGDDPVAHRRPAIAPIARAPVSGGSKPEYRENGIGAAGDITIGGQQPLHQPGGGCGSVCRSRCAAPNDVFGDVFGAPSRRDKEHHRASRKCRRESTV